MDDQQARALCFEALSKIRGDSTDSDYAKAAEIFEMLSKEENPEGMFGLADLKMRGRGVSADISGAMELYGKAAEAGAPG